VGKKGFIMNDKNIKASLHALTEAAIMIALATVFSLLRFPPFRIDLWGNGGAVDFVMVPLIILGWRRGLKWAVPAGLAFGLIDCLIGGSFGYGVLSVLFDYVVAFGAVGLAGLFKDKKYGLVLGTLVASLARFVSHFISGITIWRLAVGDEVELFGHVFGGDTAVLYSLLYNGSYMLGNMIIALLVVSILNYPLKKIKK
jgi:thiamine transporter